MLNRLSCLRDFRSPALKKRATPNRPLSQIVVSLQQRQTLKLSGVQPAMKGPLIAFPHGHGGYHFQLR